MSKKTKVKDESPQSASPSLRQEPKTPLTKKLDTVLGSTLSRATRGLSPHAYGLAFFDWATHLMTAPGKQLELLNLRSFRNSAKKNVRFASPGWEKFPFSAFKAVFQFQEAWLDAATKDIPGVEEHHEVLVNSALKQVLELLSPASLPFLNPDVLKETYTSRGSNLKNGLKNFIEDCSRMAQGQGPVGVENFKVGENVAITPGKVIFQNDLIELIQYLPTTPQVNAEPILIVPAWIMKFYILDLSPKNSLVKYLVDQGNTVFIVSWKNPGAAEHDLSLDDYLEMGIGEATDVINQIVPHQKIHAMGYCLGGTLLAISAASQSHTGSSQRQNRIKTVTLLAAQTDFTEAGEIRKYIDESQLEALQASMNRLGYLDGAQMGAAFAMLRPYEMIGSRILQEYFLGKRGKMIDIMAWNADTTRLPARMHTEYLRKLYLHNDLAEGRFTVKDKSIAIQNIALPLFVVGTQTDHVAPWQSVYKIHLLNAGDLTFLLTVGGHNAGILSEPGHANRSYKVKRRAPGEGYIAPDQWSALATQVEGSWWPEWSAWLNQHSSEKTAPPPVGNPAKGIEILDEAPGRYVLVK